MLMLELLMAGAVASTPQAASIRTPAPVYVAPSVQQVRVYDDRPVAIDRCEGGGLIQTAKVQSPELLRLGDLPKANFELAVNRTVDGCVKPAVVSYGVGK